MERHFWLERWSQNKIGFHQAQINPLLQYHWSNLHLKSQARVLVPLCGKSQDMLWLAEQGHAVIGVELSAMACESFFVESQLEYTVTTVGLFQCYQSEHIQIFCGDFFALSTLEVPKVDAVYDRAALVALPDDLRQRYAQHLQTLLAAGSQVFLIVYESSQPVIGPPFALSKSDIEKLFVNLSVLEIECVTNVNVPEHLYSKGYAKSHTNEVVYLLKK